MKVCISLISLWDQFFFARKTVELVALFRIFIGLMILQFVVLLWADLNVWFGDHAAISPGRIAEHFQFPVFSLLFMLPKTLRSIQAIFCLLAIASVTLSLGYKTRLSAAVAFLCLLTVYHSDPYILHSGDTYLRQQVFWLMFSPAGDEFSLDKWLKKREHRSFGNFWNFWNFRKFWNSCAFCPLAEIWPQRVMQFQFCLVYADSFWHKIHSSSWIDGSTIYYTSRLVEFQKIPIPLLFDHFLICQILTWSTLTLEFALCTLIWWKPLRYPILFAALIFHVGIDIAMNIPQFEWLMVISLLLFVDPVDLHRVWPFTTLSATDNGQVGAANPTPSD